MFLTCIVAPHPSLSIQTLIARPWRYWWTTWAGPALLLLYLALALYLAFLRHATYHTSLFDLGYYTQVIWNTSQGRWFDTSLKTESFLGNHFSPALAFLAPLFWIAPDARTLLVVEQLALASAVIPGYLLLRRRNPMLAPLLVIAFILNPLLHQLASTEFQGTMLAVPALALGFYALHTHRRRWFLLAIALTLLIREDMSIFVACFGVYILVLRLESRWLGLALIAIGAAWLLVTTNIIVPALGNGSYPHSILFSDFGHSIPEVIINVARNPLPLIQRLTTPDRIAALIRLFAPMAFLPIVGAGEQILWLPYLVMLQMSSEPDIYRLQLWWISPLLPFFWGSIGLTLARFQTRTTTVAAAALVAASLVGFVLLSQFPGGARFEAARYQMDAHDHIGDAIASAIPPDASLAANNVLGVHLAARRQLYLYPWYTPPHQPDLILLDMKANDPYPLSPDEVKSNVLAMQLSPRIETVTEQDGYYLFRVHDKSQNPAQGNWEWSPWLRLSGYDLAQTDASGAYKPLENVLRPGGTLRAALYWTSLAKMSKNYSVSVRLVAPDGQVIAQDDSWPARGQVPTPLWAVGRNVRDTHYLTLPPGPLPDTLALNVVLYETQSGKRIDPSDGFSLTTLHTASNPNP